MKISTFQYVGKSEETSGKFLGQRAKSIILLNLDFVGDCGSILKEVTALINHRNNMVNLSY